MAVLAPVEAMLSICDEAACAENFGRLERLLVMRGYII